MTTPSQPNDKLDRTIAEAECCKREFGWRWPDCVQYQSHEHLLAAAKRSKELEKERDELKSNYGNGFTTELVLGHGSLCECCQCDSLRFNRKVGDVLMNGQPNIISELNGPEQQVPSRGDLEQQLSTLRTAYKQALEALKYVTDNIQTNQTCSEGNESIWFKCNQILSTPLAIETRATLTETKQNEKKI